LYAVKYWTFLFQKLFSGIYTASADEVYIHGQLQYIFIFRGYLPAWSVLPFERSGDEVLATVDDAGKLGVFPPVGLFYLAVVFFGNHPGELFIFERSAFRFSSRNCWVAVLLCSLW